MKVTLDRINEDYLFEGSGMAGVPIKIDNTSGEEVKGASPMELVLMGVGGCSAIDVISILKKQKQQIDRFHIEVEGTRKEVAQAKPFEAVHVKIFLEGPIAPAKAKRAGELSFEKYCSVSPRADPERRRSHGAIARG
ncbi:MAG: OsmC family protein [Bacteroidota bacterium]